jgi:hypothetical protein
MINAASSGIYTTSCSNEAQTENFYITYTNNELSDSNNNNLNHKSIDLRKKFNSNLKHNRGYFASFFYLKIIWSKNRNNYLIIILLINFYFCFFFLLHFALLFFKLKV